jgi:hypothetical protein
LVSGIKESETYISNKLLILRFAAGRSARLSQERIRKGAAERALLQAMVIIAIAVAVCAAYLLWQIISADLSEPDYSAREDIPASKPSDDAPPAWFLNSEFPLDLAEVKVGANQVDANPR